ncbi:PTS system mannnose-specific family transporter subunit IIA [Listeria fleischmannii 1991]|uniref:phosphoenolpyruvate--glycerone phosphotransferase n=4 Tax=Listeria fleischmannii TaxID=1069827 RepID=A0A2X3J6W6_9LIST|nr:dihydroxyacetone kinase phosphoryl donor subunit DhaM [Listeria fleischmannii]MBC1406001.1 PTS-dependent dihydroxyacetone kinase phosphotransferase subunit DhaM [Listeria welshimeri]EMG28805.1 PTS system mannnose-specific family transporter subunit IIA [Listeria fleischmannii subsp. fleischmannii LU2006-1]EUJ52957.1 PTS system mannnose-specific family transporter subunit IIA [Listeria fleischmannii FSL S10-1203]KMT60121.1 PTS system mannnose-specific family transporter subunit IIA [Listeria 
MKKPYGIVIISHSANVAKGVFDIVSQVALDVSITYAGGTDEGDIGTSFDKVNEAFEQNEADKVYAFYDLGSAKMNIETVMELSEKEIILFNAPILEGAYATAAQIQMDEKPEVIQANLKSIEIK